MDKNILHRDIKPLNILFTKDNNIKLSDFGLSGIIPIISNATTMVRVDSIKGGTEYYNSPESYSDNITFKTDIWSLGVTLYQMSQLELPFGDKINPNSLKNNILYKAPKKLNINYSNDLSNLIMKMLIKDPLKRPTAKDCILLIPKIIRNKYERINFFDAIPLYNPFFPFLGIGYILNVPSIPQEIKEEFNDLYSIIYEFPNISFYNFICPDCKKSGNNKSNVIPRIKINLETLTINSFCEGGHSGQYDAKDFYKKFIDQRFELKEDTCSLCNRENECPDEIVYRYCNECNQVLCRKCEKEHKPKFPEHHLFNSLKNLSSTCEKHLKLFSHFCEDCFKNLCDECYIEHNDLNIGHLIKDIEIINDIDIKKAIQNIEETKEATEKNEELVKNMNCAKNKYYILLKLNILKLFTLYKFTFLKMYEMNNHNGIIINNYLDNNYEIFKPYLSKMNNTVFDIFAPKFHKSICQYVEDVKTKIEKNYEDTIVDIIPIEDKQLLVVLKSEIRIIKDINTLEDELIIKMDIDNILKLKNGQFLISNLNKLKKFNFIKDENNKYLFYLDFEYPEFTKDNITTFIELENEKIIALSGGHMTVLYKKDIYKNNFYLKEKIYSLVQINKKEFCTVSEIKGEDDCCNCCHIQIWDSQNINIKYNSFRHQFFYKNKNNAIRLNNDSILILANKSVATNFNNALCIFNLNSKDYNLKYLEAIDAFSKVFTISNNCFIVSYKIMGIYMLEQYEYKESEKVTLIGNMQAGDKEINNVLLVDGNLIISEKNGKISKFS